MKCVICGRRKGKRQCPAKNALICAQCCGEKRVIEINCPPDCTYLASGQSYRLGKKYSAMLGAEEDPRTRLRFYRAISNLGSLIHAIEGTIVEYAVPLQSLSDHDVHRAVATLRKTYETESKGVIFEHSSPNPLAQALSRELREMLEELRQKKDLKEDQIVEALWAVEQDICYHESGQASDSYLAFSKRNHPETASGGKDKGIIVTG